MAEYNERIAVAATDILSSVQDCLDKHQVTHAEYRDAWKWLIGLAQSGEVPLFLDVFFEAAVERITDEGKPGSEGSVQGPYHLADALDLTQKPFVLPMRDDEPGEPLLFSGRIVSLDGAPLSDAIVDMWQAGNDGTYSGFVGDAPQGNLRGRMHTDEAGAFEVRTIRPAPYQIPNSGPTGEFLDMIGRHSWRPAHLHFIVTVDGHDPLTTQLYLRDSDWLDGDGDVVGAVKDSLIIDVGGATDPGVATRFGFEGSYLTADYTFTLRPAN